jgi:hypothetical protein
MKLTLTTKEMQHFTALGEAFHTAKGIIETAFDNLTTELQIGDDSNDAEEDREDGKVPEDREGIGLFLDEIQDLIYFFDTLRDYESRLEMLKRRWALSESDQPAGNA